MLQSLIAGGQTTAHRFRMVRQVVIILIIASVTVGGLLFAFQLRQIDIVYPWSLYYQTKAQWSEITSSNVSVSSNYWERAAKQRYSSEYIELSPQRVLSVSSEYASVFLEWSYIEVIRSLYLALLTGVTLSIGFVFKGSLSLSNKHLDGKKLVPAWRLKSSIFFSGKASKVRIGSIPMIAGTETQHTLVTGGTGSGKTTLFHQMFPQIRKLGHKAVIVDMTGDFVKRYYRKGKDRILNPFDVRSEAWSPWAECQDKFDYDALAEGLVPLANCDKEDYWRSAARSVVSAVMQKLDISKKTSDLTNMILCRSLQELCEFVEGTKAAAHIDINSEKTAASIRSVASAFLEPLENVADSDTPFSIRDWVQQEDDSCLFLTSSVAHRASLRSLITTWLSVAMRGLITMEPNFTRRVWFLIDEMPSLNRIQGLDTFVVESRKFGGCGLFAIQSPAQLEMLYGKHATQVILGNCLNRVVFKEGNPSVANEISRIFGEEEVLEVNESISYGAHQMRDGVSLAAHKKSKSIVSASDIQKLKGLQAFVKLSQIDKFCRTRVKIQD